MYRGAKRRAKRLGLPFSIAPSDICIPDRCPVLGLRMRVNKGGKAQAKFSPTLDRIVPDLGYVPGNVQVISSMANRIKGDATMEELLAVAEFYRRKIFGH